MYFCESQMDQNPRTGYSYSPSGRKCLMLLGSCLWNSSRNGVFPTRSSHPRGKGGGWPKWSQYFLPNSAVRKVTPPVWGRVERPPGGLYLKSGRSGFPNGSYLWHVQPSWSLWLLRMLSLLRIALFYQLGGLCAFLQDSTFWFLPITLPSPSAIPADLAISITLLLLIFFLHDQRSALEDCSLFLLNTLPPWPISSATLPGTCPGHYLLSLLILIWQVVLEKVTTQGQLVDLEEKWH